MPLSGQAQEVTPAINNNQAITIKKLSKFDFVNPNTDFEYEVIVTNASPETITNIVMTDTWPRTFSVNGVEGGFTTWTIASLLPGQSETKKIQLHVPVETVPGNYSSRALFISQQPAIQQALDTNLEVRQVTILSAELPTTDGFDSLYLYAGAIILQLSIIASISLHRVFRD
jgi:uncharacterized repeat protein (TIGR01451 family)